MTPKEQYAARKASRECVGCGDPLPVAQTFARCDDCRGRNRRATYRARSTPERLAKARHYVASLYWSNVDLFKALASERRARNKLAGKCVDCPAPCMEDNARCEFCREQYNASRRGEPKAVIVAPVVEVTDLTRVRILRAARHLDWFSAQELTTEILEIRDATMRNTVSMMLNRLARTGRLDRVTVPVVGGIRQSGSQFQYRITRAGRDELRDILGGRVDPRKFTSGRKTA